jgi:alkylresorcinol/alkylpyrone synthase
MQILSASTAFPKYYYPQPVLLDALKRYWGDKLENPKLLRRLHQHVGVDGRFLALPVDEYPKIKNWGEANQHWIRTAEELGEKAICRAITAAGFHVRDIDALFFTSITGICSPSIDARLINRMKLSPNLKRIPIFGLGCVAGAAAIARAADYVRGFPDQIAVVLSVEICSLTLQREDLSVANLISSGLFGDGSGAVVVAGADCEGMGPEVLATRSVFYPETEEMMGWDVSEKGFRIVLSREVPTLIQRQLAGDVDSFLADNGYSRGDVGSWVLHTGGPKVLEATAAALELSHGELDASWECLRRMGNLSSASVLAVLEETMKRRRPEPGTIGVLAAMGPGFCSELVLLRW